MKSSLTGLMVALILGAIGLIVLRSMGLVKLPFLNLSPAPSASVEPNFEFAPQESVAPSASPDLSFSPEPEVGSTTKGGIVLGETTPTANPSPRTTTVTTTTSTRVVSTIRVFETKSCPVDGTAELRDITSPLTFKYSLKDGYSAKVTIWKMTGETVLSQTQISGSGVLKTIDSLDDLKLQIVSHECTSTDDTWLKLTAEK